jgi:hypothetical protein
MNIDFESIAAHFIKESFAEYHEKSKTHNTSHQLGNFRITPLLYFKMKCGLCKDKERPAFPIGRGCHTLTLEGREAFDREYVVGGPINPRTGKRFGVTSDAYKDWAAAQGKPVLTDDQFELIQNLTAGVKAHAGARELLSCGTPEAVIRAEYCGVPSQIRMDWFNPKAGIVDLKTCDDLTWFEADARRYGYAYQLAFYRAIVAVVSGQYVPVHLIAVEKKEPFRCGVWLVEDGILNQAQKENEAAIERLKACEVLGTWPTGYEERRVFDSI